MVQPVVTRKKPVRVTPSVRRKQIAAGEFKTKCLSLIDEVSDNGSEVIITKRGTPKAKLVPISNGKKKRESLLGRLEGIVDIIGDPDDLIKPVFPLEDYDMLK